MNARRLRSVVRKPILAPVIVLLLALPALWPLLRPGFFVSDDGLFHVYRIAALADAWSHGVLYPRLFPEFGFGYGQAVLNYYAPLTYYPGALLASAGFSPVTAAEVTIALGFLLAALAAYGFARSLFGPVGGVLAAVAYTYFPYHLADAYLRGAIPEHFAFVWLPLILWTTVDTFRKEHVQGPALWGGLAWAGLVFTHNLTALMIAPAWAAFALVSAAWTRRWRRLVGAIGSVALGIGLSAPLWLPFLAEGRYVGIALGPSDGYLRHLAPLNLVLQWQPFYRYRVQHGGQADHPLSWLTALLFLLVVGLFAWRLARQRRMVAAPALGFGLVLTAVSAFMITLPALPIWQPLAPILANLQYPWRFLMLTALGFSTCIGALPVLLRAAAVSGEAGMVSVVEQEPLTRCVLLSSILLLVITLALIFQPLITAPAQPLLLSAAEAWAPDRMWQEDATAGQVGATWTAEFLPLTVTEQRWALGRPREGALDGPVVTVRPAARLIRLGYDRIELEVRSSGPLSVRLHQFYLPFWQATLDGQPLATRSTGELGLVTADLPAGGGQVQFRFGPTPAWLIGAALALVAAVAWAALAWRQRRRDRALAWAAIGVLLVVAILGLNRLGVGQRTWTPRPANAAVSDVALLLGYDVAPARAADALDVTLYWFALRDIGTDYKVFVHLLGPDGAVIAQHDGDPVGGFTPTTRWRAGELVADRHRVALPAGLAPGDYGLKAGMYQPEPLRSLPVEPLTSDGRIDLGRVPLSISRDTDR